MIESNDSYWIHAYALGGGEAPGFPKYTGQWPSFSGVVGDPEMNGQMRLAYGTREGYLFVWRVRGAPRPGGAWPHYRHDQLNTGLYGLDTLRPEAILDLRRGRGRRLTLTWTAPGGDYQLGTAARYEIRMARTPITGTSFWRARSLRAVPRPARAGIRQTVVVPALRVAIDLLRDPRDRRSREHLGAQQRRAGASRAALGGTGFVNAGAGFANVDQRRSTRSSSGGLRRTIGCLLVFCSTMNAIVPQTAGTHSEIAW